LSEIRATTISDAAGTGPITLTKQSAAKAWVNYDMRSTAAIQNSNNISSLTDQGTGDATLTFTASFNYNTYGVGAISGRQGGASNCFNRANDNATTPSASALRLIAVGDNGTAYDVQTNGAIFHGDLA